MTVKKRIICLANSRKKSHRCVAGIEQLPDNFYRWIRPIGDRDGHGVTEREITLQDGTQPRPLDVLEIDLIRYAPNGNHQEDYLLDPNVPWRRVGRYTWQQATGLAVLSAPLWVNGHESGSGINDYVPEAQTVDLTDSLRLVRAEPIIRVRPAYDRTKAADVRATFQHAGQTYRLKVTDPVVEERFRAKGVGDYPLGDSILTISLGEGMWHTNLQQWQHYKLVAAVIEKNAV